MALRDRCVLVEVATMFKSTLQHSILRLVINCLQFKLLFRLEKAIFN